MLAGVALVMIIMGIWSLAAAMQLWRTYKVAGDAMLTPAGGGVMGAPPGSAADATAPAHEEAATGHWRNDRLHERR
jgi:ribulose 1,5-bisphosphate carboxylase large subunit-like protein